MKKVISFVLAFVLLSTTATTCFAEGFGALFEGYAKELSDVFDSAAKELDSVFSSDTEQNNKTDSTEESESIWGDLSTIAGGLFANDVGIPKEIHYGDYELFKEDIDLIEAYFQDYVDFMKSYDQSDFSMLTEYTSMMASYVEAMGILDSLDIEKMSSKEEEYYNKVLLRINKLLYQSLSEF